MSLSCSALSPHPHYFRSGALYLSVLSNLRAGSFFGRPARISSIVRKGENTMLEDGWHETKNRVRYKDTDRMGVVYYGNYLTFLKWPG